MTSAEPEGALRELESLQNYHVYFEGDRVKAFIEWAREHADSLYPDVGRHGYMVPPIFVHKHSTRYDAAAGAEVLQEYQKSSPKGEKAHSHVARSFFLLSPQLDDPLFIISGLEYDNLLKWVRHHPHLAPPLPNDVENRGDIDIMLIHPTYSVIFIQVKAVGDNPESRTPIEIQKKIALGGKQLRKDHNILRWVLQDWPEAASCHVTHVVALPNLTRDETTSFWPPPDLDPASEDFKYTEGVVFLCKDDLPSLEEPATPEAEVEVTPLMEWWKQHVTAVAGKSLSVPFMKDMVSRYVGMLSAVEVHAGNNLRREVRLTSDAIDVCGMMFRRILLNEQQLRILGTPCQRRYLSGPPGSGKTVLLVLRARQFLRQGGHVIVVNMYRGAAGRAIGHFIRDSVGRYRVPLGYEGGKKSKGKNKPKKKKGEERTATEDTLKAAAPHSVRTPPTPRKTAGTPPPATHKASAAAVDPRRSGSGSCSPARRVQDAQGAKAGSVTAPGAAKKPPGTPPSSGRKKDPAARGGGGVGGAPTPATPPTARRAGGQGTPPPSRKRQDTDVDMSDRVYSVDVDIDHTSFDRRDFELRIRQFLPDDVKPHDVMFVVDEIYVKEYWSKVLDVLNSGFQGCTIWCAGLYSRNPPGFEQEDLLHVLRCPPLVQKVLHAVDWDPDRRSRYRLESDSSSGVYTSGLTPLAVRHQDHQQVSITECLQCASLLATLLRHGLGLSLPLPPPTAPASSASSYPSVPKESSSPLASGSPGRPKHVPEGPVPCGRPHELQSSSLGSGSRYCCGQSTESTNPDALSCCGKGSSRSCPAECCNQAVDRGSSGQRGTSPPLKLAGCDEALADSGRSGEMTGGAGSVPLTCRDVVMLVTIPRDLYDPDERGFLDTTKQDFAAYMAYLAGCPLVASLREAGIPVRVVEDLPCWDLHNLQDRQVSAAWAYTYQGLENKVVIYLPGDTPWSPDTHQPEIPAPGLCPSPRKIPKVWKPTTATQLPTSASPPPPPPLAGGRDGDSRHDVAMTTQLGTEAGHLHCEQMSRQGVGDGDLISSGAQQSESGLAGATVWASESGSGVGEELSSDPSKASILAEQRSGQYHEGGSLGLAQYWWREEDVQRYSNWDKSNLFVAGSRCLSQLIMLIP